LQFLQLTFLKIKQKTAEIEKSFAQSRKNCKSEAVKKAPITQTGDVRINLKNQLQNLQNSKLLMQNSITCTRFVVLA
jgi:hypothetical protein